ncbi:hypothetical protein WOLCODRAFT_16174 [Wolfiporia cocos MD-104 SS10]|uniref:Uncharacterized protein n=1 Tax=Wolfiporia cocos (strain MD-104) TaxID=742152 RepID=A0A2H3JJ21_WOLCO|nr:hypothetical protein WOLCODRAFT_16174 [Wolfiporia cocos MD-104 SS10]
MITTSPCPSTFATSATQLRATTAAVDHAPFTTTTVTTIDDDRAAATHVHADQLVEMQVGEEPAEIGPPAAAHNEQPVEHKDAPMVEAPDQDGAAAMPPPPTEDRIVLQWCQYNFLYAAGFVDHVGSKHGSHRSIIHLRLQDPIHFHIYHGTVAEVPLINQLHDELEEKLNWSNESFICHESG